MMNRTAFSTLAVLSAMVVSQPAQGASSLTVDLLFVPESEGALIEFNGDRTYLEGTFEGVFDGFEVSGDLLPHEGTIATFFSTHTWKLDVRADRPDDKTIADIDPTASFLTVLKSDGNPFGTYTLDGMLTDVQSTTVHIDGLVDIGLLLSKYSGTPPFGPMELIGDFTEVDGNAFTAKGFTGELASVPTPAAAGMGLAMICGLAGLRRRRHQADA